MIRRPPRSTLFPYTTALPISSKKPVYQGRSSSCRPLVVSSSRPVTPTSAPLARRRSQALSSTPPRPTRSEEHTSELQSRQYLVCRLLLEKKKKLKHNHNERLY